MVFRGFKQGGNIVALRIWAQIHIFLEPKGTVGVAACKGIGMPAASYVGLAPLGASQPAFWIQTVLAPNNGACTVGPERYGQMHTAGSATAFIILQLGPFCTLYVLLCN